MHGCGRHAVDHRNPDLRTSSAARSGHTGALPEQRTGDGSSDVPVICSCDWAKAYTEVTLLMPDKLLQELEDVASGEGITTGQLLRVMIRAGLAALYGDSVAPPPDGAAEADRANGRRPALDRRE